MCSFFNYYFLFKKKRGGGGGGSVESMITMCSFIFVFTVAAVRGLYCPCLLARYMRYIIIHKGERQI